MIFKASTSISSFHPRGFEPRSVELEARFGEAVAAELRERGHDVHVTDPWSRDSLATVTPLETHLALVITEGAA